jgi:hypothetical protein
MTYGIELKSGRSWLLRRTWWFVIVHQNGQTIATSETYSSKQAMVDSAHNLAKTLGLVWPGSALL